MFAGQVPGAIRFPQDLAPLTEREKEREKEPEWARHLVTYEPEPTGRQTLPNSLPDATPRRHGQREAVVPATLPGAPSREHPLPPLDDKRLV